LKPYLILALVILLVAFGSACGSSTSSGTSQSGTSSPTASAADATETTRAPVTKEATATSEPLGPVFTGFDFPVQEGTCWEYEKGTFCRSCRSGPSVDSGVFRVTLGQPKEIEGLTAYEVQVTGKYRREGIEVGSGYGPRWSYRAVDDNLILVSEDGVSLTVLFDGQEGRWPGIRFFTIRFEAEDLYEGQAQGSEVVVSASTRGGEGGCVSYRSVGRVCSSGEKFDYTATETYRQGVGPVAYSYRYSYSTGSGSSSLSLSTQESVSLVRSSLQ
jgi:hypothetical protein